MNRAFDLAEEHFSIPRFLDAVDIDVDKPDEKSIMMYVAEMIKVAESRSETAKSLDEVVPPEMHKLDNLMLWTSGAEQALKKKHKLRKYTPADYRDYTEFCDVLAEKLGILDEIKSSIDPEQNRLMKASFDSLEKSNLRWRDGLDRGLPKKYTKVTEVLKGAEKELEELEGEAVPDDLSLLESRINGHNEAFGRLQSVLQEFEKLEKEATKDGVSVNQMSDIKKRLNKANNFASKRLSWLNYRETYLRLLAYLAAAQAKLNIWTEPFTSLDSVESNLNDWIYFMEMQKFDEKLLQVAEKLEQATEVMLKLDASKAELSHSTKQKCTDARQIIVELTAVKSLLSEAVQNWNRFQSLYKHLLSWLTEAEKKCEQKDMSDFFNVASIKQTKDEIDQLNLSSQFLSGFDIVRSFVKTLKCRNKTPTQRLKRGFFQDKSMILFRNFTVS